MSDPIFINIARGARDKRYMHLKFDTPEVEVHWGDNYTYVEVPCTSTMEIKRNQFHVLQTPCTVAPVKGYKVLVSINPELMQYASAPSLYMIDFGKETRIEVPAHFRKDMEPGTLTWLARLYLLS